MSNEPLLDPEQYPHESCARVMNDECEGPVCAECLDELRETVGNVMEAIKNLFTIAHRAQEREDR